MGEIVIAIGSTQVGETESDYLVIKALRQRGKEVSIVQWDRILPMSLKEGTKVVFRSVWDYPEAVDEFTKFLCQLNSLRIQTINPVELIRWNIDKRYLFALKKAGVRIPETIAPATRDEALHFAEIHLGSDIVIKPRIGGSGTGVFRCSAREVKCHDFSPQDVLLQEFCTEIYEGEYSFIFLGGLFSHCVVRRPRAPDFRVHRHFGGHAAQLFNPESSKIGQARRILEAVPGTPDYARLDTFFRGNDLICSEIELIDPALFFPLKPTAAAAFADVVISLPSEN